MTLHCINESIELSNGCYQLIFPSQHSSSRISNFKPLQNLNRVNLFTLRKLKSTVHQAAVLVANGRLGWSSLNSKTPTYKNLPTTHHNTTHRVATHFNCHTLCCVNSPNCTKATSKLNEKGTPKKISLTHLCRGAARLGVEDHQNRREGCSRWKTSWKSWWWSELNGLELKRGCRWMRNTNFLGEWEGRGRIGGNQAGEGLL